MGSVPLLTSLADTRNIATCLFFGCCFLIAYRGIADFEVRLKHAVYILTLYTIYYISSVVTQHIKSVALLKLVTFGYMFRPLPGHHQANKE
jgi:hypothetical protein